MEPLRKAGLAALLVLLGASPAAATTMLRASVEQLTRTSHRVVLGRVVAVEAQRGGPLGPHGIFTRATLQVEETWRGAPSREVVVWVHGGQVGDRRMVTHGQATFEVGERVVVFLEDVGGALFPLGMSQGKWIVDGDQVRSGAVPDMLRADDGRALRSVGPLPPRSLDALRREVGAIP